jgi:hypothetical protein
MSNNKPKRKWDQHGKPDAIVDVLTYIMSQTFEEGQKCVNDDSYARQLFEDPDLGNITVPNNVRLVFVPTGDRAKNDGGSVVIELPDPASGAAPANPNVVRYPAELSDHPRNWDKFGKCAAIRDVVRHIISNPQVGQYCLNSDVYARNLFQSIGGIEVPNDVKVIFVPAGEKASLEFGSLIIELPAPGPVPAREDMSAPNPLLQYVLCCYSLWLK